jgi:ParB family chromosome partitioning protein
VKKTKRLGKGLSALIPETGDVPSSGSDGQLTDIEIASIKANPFQPRLEFDPTALGELKESIREKGIIQPITVRKVNGGFELIAGERRLRAVTDLGLKTVPAYIISVETKEEMLELALIENVQREKLNPIEQAKAYQRLIEECNLTQDEVAKKIGKDRTTITNFIRLLRLPKEIQTSVQNDEISMGHARALLAVDSKNIQNEIWRKIIKNNLSVRKVEKLVKDTETINYKKTQKPPRRSVYIQKAEEELREKLGTKVSIRSRRDGGAIEVEFYSPEDLNRLLELFDKIKE